MKKYIGIKEEVKNKLLDSILVRLNGLTKARWEEIASEGDNLQSTMNAIIWDIRNLQSGLVPSHLRKRIDSPKSSDLLTRKMAASVRRIRQQTASVKFRLEH